MTGSTIGRFRITGELGAGGMGVVYRAEDPDLGRDVAVKILPDAVADDPERIARFRREARSLGTLAHAGIVTVTTFPLSPRWRASRRSTTGISRRLPRTSSGRGDSLSARGSWARNTR